MNAFGTSGLRALPPSAFPARLAAELGRRSVLPDSEVSEYWTTAFPMLVSACPQNAEQLRASHVSGRYVWLLAHRVFCWPNRTGQYKASYRRKKDAQDVNYTIPYGKKGAGDIIGLTRSGRHIEVECKHSEGRASRLQAFTGHDAAEEQNARRPAAPLDRTQQSQDRRPLQPCGGRAGVSEERDQGCGTRSRA
jgi:hypothetical protein